MSDDIVTALKALDPANDAHWTADGLPRLDALPGNPSRKAVTDALPGFNRAKAAEQEVAPASQPDPEAGNEQDASETQPDADADGDEDLADADDGLDRAEVALEETEAEVAEAEAAMEAARKKLAEAQAKRDAALEAQADTRPHHKKVVDDIQHYLARQQADREERHELRAAAVKAIGGPKNAALLQAKSPLDASMTRKTGRGRPNFAPKE